MLANIGLVVAKGTAGILGNSYALIADAIESGMDVFTSAIIWFGLRTAAKAPDADHPYGHGKAEPVATIMVSVLLIVAAVGIAYQSFQHILTPHKTPAPFTLVILLVVVVVKELLFRYTQRVGNEVNSGAVKADAWHHRSDALTSLAAFVGISIAVIGGEGYESADDWAALVASVIIVYNGYHLFRPAFAEIMDAAPSGDWASEIRAIALRVEGVMDIEKCFVRKMGLEYFVDLHVIVDGDQTVRFGHDVAHAVKKAILEAKPVIYDVLVHVEPHR